MSSSHDTYRFQSDARQFGGLLMLLSFAALINSMSGIISAYGPNGAVVTDAKEPPFWILFSYFCQFIWATVGAFTGYMACVHDYSSKWINVFLMVAIQTIWIGYITMMVMAGQGAREDVFTNPFVPPVYNPKPADIRFIGAMGIFGVICYGIGFAGSIAFMIWGLQSYTMNTKSHSGDYFKGRMYFYSSILAIAGMIQFLLGCVVRGQYGDSLFRYGPVTCVFWVITYPGINIFIGLIQMFNGVWGIARAMGMCNFGALHFFQWSLALQWVFVLVLQDLVTSAYWGTSMAVYGPMLATWSLGLTLMPAYLDHKHQSLPETFPVYYYGINPSLSGPDLSTMSHHASGDDNEDKMDKDAAPEAPMEVQEGV
uniref:Uncharacterized protein n=1 Tax=Pseudo-nitzschia australis TaxID=44445 RepID=A0A7S4AXC9_9STRA